ncbi:MAG: hypothetical protein RR458_02120 [Clostridia bacterium]
MNESVITKWNNPKQTVFGIKQFIIWFTFSVTMLAVAIFTAQNPVWANLPLNVVAGVAVLIFCKPVMFEKLKLTTLLTLRFVIALFVIFNWNGKTYADLVLILLVINILEATFTDLLKNKQYFNFVSGLALAIGVLGLVGRWDITTEALYHIEGYGVWATVAYMVGYTIWNWIFVSGEFSPSVTLMHVGFLSTPIIGAVILGLSCGSLAIGFGFWLLLRANTLTFGGIMQIAAKQYWEESLYNEKFAKFIDVTHKNSIQIVCMVICVALMAFVVVARFIA